MFEVYNHQREASQIFYSLRRLEQKVSSLVIKYGSNCSYYVILVGMNGCLKVEF